MPNIYDIYDAPRESIITEITMNLTATTTTITVVNANIMWPAPNVATLYSDDGEHSETIYYGGKTATTLTGVIRNFENRTSAQSWAAGTNIINGFSSYFQDRTRKNIMILKNAIEDLEDAINNLDLGGTPPDLTAIENDISDIKALINDMEADITLLQALPAALDALVLRVEALELGGGGDVNLAPILADIAALKTAVANLQDDTMRLVLTADKDNIAIFDEDGQVVDSGKSIDDIPKVGTDIFGFPPIYEGDEPDLDNKAPSFSHMSRHYEDLALYPHTVDEHGGISVDYDGYTKVDRYSDFKTPGKILVRFDSTPADEPVGFPAAADPHSLRRSLKIEHFDHVFNGFEPMVIQTLVIFNPFSFFTPFTYINIMYDWEQWTGWIRTDKWSVWDDINRDVMRTDLYRITEKKYGADTHDFEVGTDIVTQGQMLINPPPSYTPESKATFNTAYYDDKKENGWQMAVVQKPNHYELSDDPAPAGYTKLKDKAIGTKVYYKGRTYTIANQGFPNADYRGNPDITFFICDPLPPLRSPVNSFNEPWWTWPNSQLHKELNTSTIMTIPRGLRSLIEEIRIPVLESRDPVYGTVGKGDDGLLTRLFIPSLAELNVPEDVSGGTPPLEGAAFDLFTDQASRIMRNESNVASTYWTRSPFNDEIAGGSPNHFYIIQPTGWAMILHSQLGNSAYVPYCFALSNNVLIYDNTDELISPYPDDAITFEYRGKMKGVWSEWQSIGSNGNGGVSAVYTDDVSTTGAGTQTNPIRAITPVFTSKPDDADLPTFGIYEGMSFAVLTTGTGGGLPLPTGGVQQYTYVYRMDEVKIHPESDDHWFNLITVDAPWALPIIAANEAAGRPRYAGIKISMQLPGTINPDWQNKLGLNIDINEPLSDMFFDVFTDVFSKLGGYEASYLEPEGIYNFTFNDSEHSWAQNWRVDNDGMYRTGGTP